MIGAPEIELATHLDLDSLARLRETFDWYPNEALLRGILAADGAAMFVMRAGGVHPPVDGDPDAIVATTSALAAPPVGVIGNVSVRPDAQRRGLARRIMLHTLDWLRAHGVRRVSLDATPAGRPLYRSLGFTDVGPSWFAAVAIEAVDMAALRARPGTLPVTARSLDTSNAALDAIIALDSRAYGGDRSSLLQSLTTPAITGVSGASLYRVDASDGSPVGYAIARWLHTPRPLVRLGPLVATEDSVAAALTHAAVEAALASPQRGDSPTTIITSGGSPHARAFFAQMGMGPAEDDLIMRLDIAPGEAERLPDSAANDAAPLASDTQGLAHSPSVYSWIAPMVF